MSLAQDSKSVVGPGFRQRFGALRVRSSCNVDAGNEIYKVPNSGASVFELFFAPSMPKQDIGFFAVGPTVEWYTRDTHVHRTAAHTGTRPTNSGPL